MTTFSIQWLYWPSFNGFCATREYYSLDRALINTVLSLCGATTTTFIVSKMVNGKFNMVHIQNATLAGGVAVGAAADLYLHPAGAIGIGCFAGAISVCGFDWISNWMENRLGIADTCGVHNLHGIPGILGGIVSAIAIAAAEGTDIYADSHPWPLFSDGTSYQKQAGMQIAGIAVTIGIAVVSGLIVGFMMRFMSEPPHEFTDMDNFDIPGEREAFLHGIDRLAGDPQLGTVQRDD